MSQSSNIETSSIESSNSSLKNNLKDLRQLSDVLGQQANHANMETNSPKQTATPAKDVNQFDINESTYKTSHAAVRKARRFALQGLYEWLMTDYRFEQTGQGDWKSNAPHDIAARTRATNAMHTVHLGYYHELMREIPAQIEALDTLISQHLDRSIFDIDTVEHAILLIGTYELKHSLHIPYKVVLDEAMKLNTHFGATDAHKLINAVLDKLASELRSVEVKADIKTDTKSKAQATSLDKATSSQPSEVQQEKSLDTDDNQPIIHEDKPSKPRIGLKKGTGSVKTKPTKAKPAD